MSVAEAINLVTKQRLAHKVNFATSFFQRLRGLLGRIAMAEGEGLFIPGCRSIHTFFMAFPIDVLFLDKNGRVTKSVSGVHPFRVVFGPWNSTGVLELPYGTLNKNQCSIGDKMSLIQKD